MKRIQSACICQTLHFMLKEDAEHDWAVRQVAQEVERYMQHLDRSRIRYKILDQTTQPDGSVVLRVIKQYNNSPVGHYLD